MSASTDLQAALLPIITSGLSRPVGAFAARPRELVTQLEMACQDFGISLHLLPPLPQHFLQGNSFVFFDKVEIRVRITEWPDLNSTGLDAYDLCEEVALALHWQPFNKLNAAVQALMTDDGLDIDEANEAARADAALAPWWALSEILAHPLQLAARPIDPSEDKEKRIFDVVFEGQYQLNGRET